ncbi:MAG: T9SS type A sorting domain-containing protein [Chthoniobacterales bacterium]
MKTLFLAVGLCLFLMVAAATNGAGVPTMNVTVSDAAGKLAFKGATKGDGGFATEKLQPGNYVVQLTSKNAALKGGQFSIVVSAGKKKVVANSVAGEKFLAGGVAMKVEVAAGLNITGQVAAGPLANTPPKNNNMRKPGDAQESARKTMTQTPDKMPAPPSY